MQSYGIAIALFTSCKMLRLNNAQASLAFCSANRIIHFVQNAIALAFYSKSIFLFTCLWHRITLFTGIFDELK